MNYTLSVLLLISFTAQAQPTDPFDNIERLKFDNGLEVYLAPSDQAAVAEIRLEVKVGWEAETRSNYGISHLLEHVLFRDKNLTDEMTYLQLIKEAGGSANGQTERRMTSYFGSIPSAKSSWLLEQFEKMILQPTFSDEYVQKEKGTVELERGRPSPFNIAFGFSPSDVFYLPYLQPPSFWKTEFNVDYETPYTLTQEQLSTRRLTLEQIRQHYTDYYYPSNMRLFIAGKFDRAKIMEILKSKWASLPKREGKKLSPEPTPRPNLSAYVRRAVGDLSAYVRIGTKVWDASVRDQVILDSYVEYLAHRMMKEIRNTKGQTYSASGYTSFYPNYGYAIVSFETPKENFHENLLLAKKHIHDEAELGGLRDDQVKEAISLYQAQYGLREKEAKSMMSLAEKMADIIEANKKFDSPYSELENTTPTVYNETLKKFFRPDHAYETTHEPPVLFAYDIYLFYFVVAFLTFRLLRRWILKPFAHDRIRWVRKVRLLPLRLTEGIMLCLSILAVGHVYFLLQLAQAKFNFLNSHILLSYYGLAATFTIAALGIVQAAMAFLPGKLMIESDSMVIKSVSYYSVKIPLSEIQSVTTERAATLIFSLVRLWKLKHRFYFLSPWLWRKGLLIQLRNGRAYFFNVDQVERAKTELNAGIFDPTRTKPGQHHPSPFAA